MMAEKITATMLARALNELAERLPRITATLCLAKIKIDLGELAGAADAGSSATAIGRRRLPVTFDVHTSEMSFVDLLNGMLLADESCVSSRLDAAGRVRFQEGP